MSVRVRFAPSPTGQLHVGNARTALFNWAFARSQGGVFVLRIEDTDSARQQDRAEESIYEDLQWLGLMWDEGPVPASQVRGDQRLGDGRPDSDPSGLSADSSLGAVGEYGPYRQSERRALYDDACARLIARGAAYPCFCSEEVLSQDREQSLAAGRTPGYSGRCGQLPPAEAERRRASGEACAIRFRVGAYGIVHDLIRGEVDFRSRPAFDPVIVRADGRPTYNFAVVVDDALMAISHVLRGEDHLTNSALQLRLYEELGLRPPLFAHLPLILGPDGAPLSKRHGATSVGEMRQRGYPAEALANALALLGWTPPGERVLLSLGEIPPLFDLKHVNPAPAIFDYAKLDWLGGQKIRAMEPARRGRAIGTFLERAGLLTQPPKGEVGLWLERVGEALATGIGRFDQAPEAARFLVVFDRADAIAAGALEGEEAPRALGTFLRLFEESGGVAEGAVPGLIEKAKGLTGLKGRPLLHPLRAAVTGQESGLELARVLPLIETAARLQVVPGVLGPAQRIRRVLEGP